MDFGLSLDIILKLILVNIVLSGDNAVVIAMASKNLPKEHQKKAIFWGTFGAVVLRLILAAVVVKLMAIPYLTAIGSILLFIIAIKLLTGEEGTHKEGGASVWSAIQTIIIADIVMSLDNVVALAGVAQGNLVAIAVGIVISIPIIIFGSQIILKAMVRYPFISYIGSGILAWTAGEMMTSETKFHHLMLNDFHWLIPAIFTTLAIGIGYLISKIKAKKTVA